MKWSFSSLKMFLNCPYQYFRVKVVQDFAIPDTQQTLYGKDVHTALEQYGRDGEPLPKNYQRFQPIVDVLLDLPGDKYFEYQMALRTDKTPCGFEDEDYWVRGIADFLCVDGDTAHVVDYKTGSDRFPETKQLKLMALMVFAIFPEVQTVKGGLAFIMRNSFVEVTYTRDEIPAMWAKLEDDLVLLQDAFAYGTWVPKPSGLCGWCPVRTCDHHPESR